MGGRMSSILTRHNNKDTPLTCLVIGAGSRGSAYAEYATLYPKELKVVGVAEPSNPRRKRMVKNFSISPDKEFSDWREAVKQEKFADFVIVATCDQDHKDPTIAFARLGYDILLEKPMAVTEEDCRAIYTACTENSVKLAVCHVLRYTPWVLKIKDLIDSGAIGDVASIRHTEPIGYWHFAHSFVRGNWRKEETSTFSLMAKSCHDIDLINYWMAPHKCAQVSSFGKLSHFTSKDKPTDAGSRCVECPVEHTCPYSAKRFYLDQVKMGNQGWPVDVISDIVDIENVTDALKTGPYGKCVYDTDNDVMSHQVVTMQYSNGATVTFNMVAFTWKVCAREVKIYGTKGELTYEDGWSKVQVFDFLTQQTELHSIPSDHPREMGGHGGADFHLMHSFLTSLKDDSKQLVTGPAETLHSHLLVFAAEKARKENTVVLTDAVGL